MNITSFYNRWRKKFAKQYIRVIAERATDSYIARGAAIGMFIGLLIPMSAQLIFAIPLAFAFKGSKIAAALFTCITNPLTVIIIYPFQIYIGNLIINGKLLTSERINEILSELKILFEVGSWSELSTGTWWKSYGDRWFELISGVGLYEIVLPFFAAGLLMAIIATPLTYYMMLRAVKKYKAFRKEKRLKRNLSH